MADEGRTTDNVRAQLIVQRFARDALIVIVGIAIVWFGGVLRSLHLADGERDVFEAVNHLPDRLRPPIEGVMFLGTLAAVPIVAVVALLQRRVRLGVLLLCAGSLAYGVPRLAKVVVEGGRPLDVLPHVDVIVRGRAGDRARLPVGAFRGLDGARADRGSQTSPCAGGGACC